MKDIQKDILLYWSGEADDKTTQRVRERIEWDFESQTYLNDLEAINKELSSKDDILPPLTLETPFSNSCINFSNVL